MFQSVKTKIVALLAFLVTAMVATPAFAQVDVGEATAAIAGAAAPIAAIGGAVLLVLVGIKVYKWVRRAM